GALTGRRCLAPELTKDVRREQNTGNEQRSRCQPIGRNLLLQNADELAHAAPSLSGGEPRLAGYDPTGRGNQHVLHIAPPDMGSLICSRLIASLISLVRSMRFSVANRPPPADTAAVAVPRSISGRSRNNRRNCPSSRRTPRACRRGSRPLLPCPTA